RIESVAICNNRIPPDFKILGVLVICKSGRRGRREVYCALDGVKSAGGRGDHTEIIECFDGYNKLFPCLCVVDGVFVGCLVTLGSSDLLTVDRYSRAAIAGFGRSPGYA